MQTKKAITLTVELPHKIDEGDMLIYWDNKRKVWIKKLLEPGEDWTYLGDYENEFKQKVAESRDKRKLEQLVEREKTLSRPKGCARIGQGEPS